MSGAVSDPTDLPQHKERPLFSDGQGCVRSDRSSATPMGGVVRGSSRPSTKPHSGSQSDTRPFSSSARATRPAAVLQYCSEHQGCLLYRNVQGSPLLSATVRVYSLVAPCRLSDLISLALLGSVSGQPGLSRGLLPGYKTVSKWRLQLQDSTPPPSTYFHKDFAPFFTPQHLWDVISCLLSCQTAPWHLLVKSDSSNLCFVRL